MQLEQRIGKRATVGATVDNRAIFDSRKMPEISIGAPILLVEKRTNFAGKARQAAFGLGRSFHACGFIG